MSQPVPKKLAVGMQQAWTRNRERQQKNRDALACKKLSLGALAAKPATKTASKRKVMEEAQSAASESKHQKQTVDASVATCQRPGVSADTDSAPQPSVISTPAKKVQKTIGFFFQRGKKN